MLRQGGGLQFPPLGSNVFGDSALGRFRRSRWACGPHRAQPLNHQHVALLADCQLALIPAGHQGHRQPCQNSHCHTCPSEHQGWLLAQLIDPGVGPFEP